MRLLVTFDHFDTIYDILHAVRIEFRIIQKYIRFNITVTREHLHSKLSMQP